MACTAHSSNDFWNEYLTQYAPTIALSSNPPGHVLEGDKSHTYAEYPLVRIPETSYVQTHTSSSYIVYLPLAHWGPTHDYYIF
jgi:hypothetical protein